MRYQFQHGDRLYEIHIERLGESYQALLDGQAYPLEVLDTQPGLISLRFAGRTMTLHWAVDGGTRWVSVDGCTYALEKPAPRRARHSGEAEGSESARAPMPAQVRAVQVAEGDTVEKGQTLLLLEAMKMEIRIKAPAAGQVKKLHVSPGQTVEKDQPLVEIQSGDGK